jgi:hypothetical protein
MSLLHLTRASSGQAQVSGDDGKGSMSLLHLTCALSGQAQVSGDDGEGSIFAGRRNRPFRGFADESAAGSSAAGRERRRVG